MNNDPAIVGLDFCAGCGADLPRSKNHHCDPKRERKIENARKAHRDKGYEFSHSFMERLADGFRFAQQSN